MKRSPRRNFFRHKSYSFLSREVRLMILLFYKIGVQWGYKSHPHSLKALILSLFSQKYGFWANYSILLQVYCTGLSADIRNGSCPPCLRVGISECRSVYNYNIIKLLIPLETNNPFLQRVLHISDL